MLKILERSGHVVFQYFLCLLQLISKGPLAQHSLHKHMIFWEGRESHYTNNVGTFEIVYN